MFEYIRTHQRLMQFLLLLFVLPSFAFLGLESYGRMGGANGAVVTVAGQPITQQEWDAAQREQLERMKRMYGAQFDPKMFDTPELKHQVLENLIAQRALLVEAARQHVLVPDRVVQQAVLETPGLLQADGKFDGARYKELLALQGMTPEMYEAKLRQDLALQQLNGAIQGTAFAPRSVTSRLSDLSAQQRVVRESVIKAVDFKPQVKVTEQMLKDYYDHNIQQFTIPEHVKIEYLVLDTKALAAQAVVSEDDIKSYYEQNASHYTTEEQRRASHILIAVGKDAPANEQAAAKAKAEALLAKLRSEPASFAKLAAENSQDPGSAGQGGDLGFFSRDAMVKPFADAAFSLKEGQISDLVRSDFGYHIIQLTAIKPAVGKPLAEVHDQIKADIQKQLVAKKFSEQAELFNNTTYEQADSLKPAAEQLKLSVQTASNVTRTPNPALAPSVAYNHPAFLKALFTDDVLRDKHNSAVVEVAPNTLISGRVVEHVAAAKRAFAEVQATVRERVIEDESIRLARAEGERRLAALRGKDDASGFGPEKVVSRAQNQELARATVAAIMKADVHQLPTYVGQQLPNQDYAIFRISKVQQPPHPDTARRQSEQQQIADVLAQQEMAAYLAVLKHKAEVEFSKPKAAEAAADSEPAAGS